MNSHVEQQVRTIGEAFSSLDHEKCEKLLGDCVRTIGRGGSIIATALGKNVPICEKFVGTLNSLGIDAHFMNTNSAVHGDLGMVKQGDLVLVLSKSGETEETIYLARLLARRETTNWLMCANAESRAAQVIENVMLLEVPHEGDPWNLVPNNSTIIFLIFLQALSMELIDRLPVSIDVFRQNHPGGNIGKVLGDR